VWKPTIVGIQPGLQHHLYPFYISFFRYPARVVLELDDGVDTTLRAQAM